MRLETELKAGKKMAESTVSFEASIQALNRFQKLRSLKFMKTKYISFEILYTQDRMSLHQSPDGIS